MGRIMKFAALAALTLAVAGCASTWRTYYATPVDPAAWRPMPISSGARIRRATGARRSPRS